MPVEVRTLEGLLAKWYRSNGVVAWLAAEVGQLKTAEMVGGSAEELAEAARAVSS